MDSLLDILANFITSIIGASGYLGVVFLMAVESACIPLPSEVIMPFSGFLVATGTFNLWWLVLAGTLGNVLGSWIAYGVGKAGGRPLIEKYGKYILVSHKDLDRADNWFAKFGDRAVLISRLLPVVRTFISFPAGVAKMPFWKFTAFTALGAFPFVLFLAWIGQILGENWETIRAYFRGADYLILAVIVVAVGLWIWKHVKESAKQVKQ
jgi:membrane protein DedA with SNARE-associated domain